MASVSDPARLPATTPLPQWTIGDRLRKARRFAGLQAAELAAEIGVHPNTISNYENDRGTPDQRTLISWAVVTDVPVGWLIHGDTYDAAAEPLTRSRSAGLRRPRNAVGQRYRATPSQLRWKTARRGRGLILITPAPPGGSPDTCRSEAPPCRLPAVDTPHATATDLVTSRSAAH